MRGPLPEILLPLAVPASRIYSWCVGRRNHRFDQGCGVRRLPVPVISVGNLTTGGVGKTPMVTWIVEQLAGAGHHPAVAMRGYAARPGERSDEEAEYAERLPGVVIVADPDRHTAVSGMLCERADVDVVILDDGFQHRCLHRDLDLVLIDAKAGTLADRVLPAGHLREPVAALARADAVIVTHAECTDDSLAAAIAGHLGRPPVAWTRHAWPHLRVMEPGHPEVDVDLGWLAGKRVLTLLGVGRPDLVREQIEAAGARIVAAVRARDHERYDRSKLLVARGLCIGVDALVMTGKDWVKVRELIDLATWPAPIVVPRLRLEFIEGAASLSELVRSAVRRELS